MSNRHGGQRPGAGRSASNYKRINVMLGESHVERAKKLGDGNLSRGLRKAIEKTKGSK